jgi:lactate permease
MLDQFKIITNPVSHSVGLSAIFAVLPLLALFILLGVLRLKAWVAGLISLAVALIVAIAVYSMPVGQALLSGSEGAAFGFFPILWIVINAIWVYNLTVASGHFDVLRRSFEQVSADRRIQAIIIAFCFGALLEALAGFGTPVAITVVMLMVLGFPPMRAAAVSLIANTAPVAFGALATPITTLAATAHGANPDPRLTVDTIGSMVGRQTPILSLVVPLVLVYVVDGRRGLRQTWPAAVVAGVAFGVAQFVASNYMSVPLTDIIASLFSAACVVVLVRVWQPVESPELAESVGAATVPGQRAALRAREIAAAGTSGGLATATVGGAGGGGDEPPEVPGGTGAPAPTVDSRADVAKAYAPYLIIIVLFSIANITAVKNALAKSPWTVKFQWPGMNIVGANGKPVSSATFTLNWLPAAGTLMVIAGIITTVVLGLGFRRALRAYLDTYVALWQAIVTVMAVLGLAYVLNQSGQTGTLGAWLAGAGGVFVIFSSILGWLGVAVTGSDTSSNALFGALQVQTAAKAGLDPLLLAAANSSGGVLGKMISPQNLAIAAAAVGMPGKEGEIFRRVFAWSVVLVAFMCLIVALQDTPVLRWMVP